LNVEPNNRSEGGCAEKAKPKYKRRNNVDLQLVIVLSITGICALGTLIAGLLYHKSRDTNTGGFTVAMLIAFFVFAIASVWIPIADDTGERINDCKLQVVETASEPYSVEELEALCD
jgi:hypothetical protein